MPASHHGSSCLWTFELLLFRYFCVYFLLFRICCISILCSWGPCFLTSIRHTWNYLKLWGPDYTRIMFLYDSCSFSAVWFCSPSIWMGGITYWNTQKVLQALCIPNDTQNADCKTQCVFLHWMDHMVPQYYAIQCSVFLKSSAYTVFGDIQCNFRKSHHTE